MNIYWLLYSVLMLIGHYYLYFLNEKNYIYITFKRLCLQFSGLRNELVSVSLCPMNKIKWQAFWDEDFDVFIINSEGTVELQMFWISNKIN